MLKYIFPLSAFYKTPKKFFASLVIHIGIYLVGTNIPLPHIDILTTVYIFISALILFVNYFLKSKKTDSDNKE